MPQVLVLVAAGATACSTSIDPGAQCSGGKCDDLGADAAPGNDAGPGAATCAGSFPARWLDGTACPGEPEFQVHRYDDDTFILRQSLCTDFEAPFLFLLFGDDKVLLEDTGAGGVDVVGAVDRVIADWLAARGRSSIDLVVVNSHGHGDHTAGNAAFAARPRTNVVGFTVPAISSFFGISPWPTDTGSLDLGRRIVDVVPIPGHQGADLALYDRQTGLLLTGDTLYPGRLIVRDFAAYRTSIRRMVDFTAEREVCAVLGAHIEMTSSPRVDFAPGAPTHPEEHPLALGRDHLVELGESVDRMGNQPTAETHDDFIIEPI